MIKPIDCRFNKIFSIEGNIYMLVNYYTYSEDWMWVGDNYLSEPNTNYDYMLLEDSEFNQYVFNFKQQELNLHKKF